MTQTAKNGTFAQPPSSSPYLHVGARLVRHLHDELAALPVGLADQLVQDVEVHRGPQVVNVGHEDVLAALRDQLVQQARVVEAGVNVPVAGGVPGLGVGPVHAQVRGHREEGLFVDAGVPLRRRSETRLQLEEPSSDQRSPDEFRLGVPPTPDANVASQAARIFQRIHRKLLNLVQKKSNEPKESKLRYALMRRNPSRAALSRIRTA